MNSKNSSRMCRIRRFAIAATAAVATALLGLSAAVPAQAAAESTLENPYVIQNLTGQKMTLAGVDQPGGTEPGDNCVYGKGFGTTPPKEIGPGQTATFSVPAYEFDGCTKDHTTVYYTTPDGKKFDFFGLQHLTWFDGTPSFFANPSECGGGQPQYNCLIVDSHVPGGPTVFTAYKTGNNGATSQ